MLPTALLDCSVSRGRIIPRFLGAADHPWLRVLLDEYLRFAGRPWRDLDERLREPLPCASPTGKRNLAIHVLGGIFRDRQAAALPPPAARAAVFGAAVETEAPRSSVLSSVAGSLRVSPRDLEHALFADLPGERLVVEPKVVVSPDELALRANLALAQALLFRSSTIRLEIEGNARAVVRHARLRGLLCVVSATPPGEGATLDISGPLSLFHRTLLYGRRLGELVPLLGWCRRFRLDATCHLRGESQLFQLATGDPVFPSVEPRRYDSKLEERFARDFSRLTTAWDIVREPEPVRAGAALVFPDFAISHRHDSSRRWLVEIVGFWTSEYLHRKLARYRDAGLTNLVLCVDEERNCAPEELPAEARVVRFRRRVDAAAVLRTLEGHA